MQSASQELLQRALELPREEREHVAHALLESLDLDGLSRELLEQLYSRLVGLLPELSAEFDWPGVLRRLRSYLDG